MAISKSKAQIKHFMRRFCDRTGKVCDIDLYESICRDIRKGRLIKIGYQSKRTRLYEYYFNDERFILIYDCVRKNPVTILFWDKEFLKENGIIYKNKKYYDLK